MEFIVITIFKEIFDTYFNSSLPKKGIDRGVISYKIISPRDFTEDRHRKVDDYTYGGGPGMLMMFPPVKKSIDRAREINSKTHVILLSPQGIKFNQEMAKELSKLESITLVCGHYEGIDERIKNFIDEEISIGDFITSGGEIPALVVIDSVIRLIPEFLEKEETIKKETFEDKLLEYPQYTRPETFEGYRIPEILKSGHHEKINLWRKREMLKRTLLLRPDLLMDRKLTDEEKELIKDIFDELLENMNKILKRE